MMFDRNAFIICVNTFLLFAAANQTLDGYIRIFEVDEYNFHAVMGPPPLKNVIVR